MALGLPGIGLDSGGGSLSAALDFGAGPATSGDIGGNVFNLGIPPRKKVSMAQLLVSGGIILAAVVLWRKL